MKFNDVAKPRLEPAIIFSHDSIIVNHMITELKDIPLVYMTPAHLKSLYI